MTTEKTRDENFEALCDLIQRLQREGALNFDQALEVSRAALAFGHSCAQEANDTAWATATAGRKAADQDSTGDAR